MLGNDRLIVEPASHSRGYIKAREAIAEQAQSSSILELMGLVPAIFQDVRAVELMNEASRAGSSRYVRGFVDKGTITSIAPVPEDGDEARLKGMQETSLEIRLKSASSTAQPSQARPLPIDAFGIASQADIETERISSIMIFSKGRLRLRDGSMDASEADIEEEAVLRQLSDLLATALGSRIGRLTLLPNKTMFEAAAEAAENAFRRDGREFSLAVADIDRLWSINQEHSYAAGDMVLAAVADRLRNSLAACGYKGSVIFRPGKNKFLHGVRKESEAAANPHLKHDEFALVLPKSLKEAAGLADLLRQEIAIKPVEFQLPLSGGVMATCSFGVAHSSNPTDKGGSLWHGMLDACVRLLEAAKSRGGDTVMF
jgi:GGDEF domain-containing protein